MLWLIIYEDCKQPEFCNNIRERLAEILLSLLNVNAQLCMCVLGCKTPARRHPWSSCYSHCSAYKFVSDCFGRELDVREQ